MKSRKETERQQLLMESSLTYPRGKKKKVETQKGGKNLKIEKTLGYLGVVNPVIPKGDVPLMGSEHWLNIFQFLRLESK
ncbi:hypothetical protein AVEN_173404-1 [Araneus ventricosus]|uniref:Uncharacterized protein n=1 Tax=Araneus ventricosus TaxID=182803 RepID=A0A4Y2MZ39_ARAVE|nr:hypothetical protein AVEN_173404-1 [Araneus ventricosus]